MKYILAFLLVATSGMSWVAYGLKSKYEQCKALPDIRSSFAHVSKYIGTDRSFRFTLVCSGEINDFYKDCAKTDMQDVTHEAVVLKPYKNGKFFKSSYALDWIEKINYFVDLSDPTIWNIDAKNAKITLSLPEVKFERVLDNKKLLPFVIDKKWGTNDKDYLLKIIEKSDEFSLPKSQQYLDKYRAVIEGEMAKSLKKLVSNVALKMQYPTDTAIEVKFKNKVY